MTTTAVKDQALEALSDLLEEQPTVEVHRRLRRLSHRDLVWLELAIRAALTAVASGRAVDPGEEA